jgi:NAD(P)H-nitrite reductase large subunit
MLTKALLSDFSDDQMAVEKQEWFDENRICFVRNIQVESIDPQAKTVTAGGNEIAYDKLIYALGAYCFVPPFKGHDLDKVVSIRTIEDAARIKDMIPHIKTAAVIGGGVLGLEAAWSLCRAKVKVTVIEGAPALMARQLNPAASAMIKTLAEDAGVKVYTAASTSEINEEGVVLADGTVIPADLVIVSTGVRGNLTPAKDAGLTISRSIVVNDHMETNLPDIYAAGDCAECGGINYALWSQSVEQGKTAGANAAGDDVSYETVDGALSFNGMNTSLFAIGDNGTDPSKLYKTVETTDLRRRQYEKYVFEKNRLVGVILIGDTSRLAELTMKVKDHAKFSDVIKL